MSLTAAAFDVGLRTDLVLYALTDGVIALSIARSRLTAPLRKATVNSPFMLGELISCGYCLSHWGGIIFATLIGGPLLTMIIHAGAITAGAIIWMGLANKLWWLQETELEDMRDLVREATDALIESNKR